VVPTQSTTVRAASQEERGLTRPDAADVAAGGDVLGGAGGAGGGGGAGTPCHSSKAAGTACHVAPTPESTNPSCGAELTVGKTCCMPWYVQSSVALGCLALSMAAQLVYCRHVTPR
jgi:hypothetical protein